MEAVAHAAVQNHNDRLVRAFLPKRLSDVLNYGTWDKTKLVKKLVKNYITCFDECNVPTTQYIGFNMYSIDEENTSESATFADVINQNRHIPRKPGATPDVLVPKRLYALITKAKTMYAMKQVKEEETQNVVRVDVDDKDKEPKMNSPEISQSPQCVQITGALKKKFNKDTLENIANKWDGIIGFDLSNKTSDNGVSLTVAEQVVLKYRKCKLYREKVSDKGPFAVELADTDGLYWRWVLSGTGVPQQKDSHSTRPNKNELPPIPGREPHVEDPFYKQPLPPIRTLPPINPDQLPVLSVNSVPFSYQCRFGCGGDKRFCGCDDLECAPATRGGRRGGQMRRKSTAPRKRG